MKIITIQDLIEEEENSTDLWTVTETVLGPAKEEQYVHIHKFPKETLEWRIAEYSMDPNDVNAVLHLIMHEVVLDKRTEVTCWTPGYSQEQALAKRLEQIQVHIDKHTARMKPAHQRLAVHLPHEHPTLDPVRERGVQEEALYPRRLLVEGIIDKREGRSNRSVGKIREAHALLHAEIQNRKLLVGGTNGRRK